VQEFDQAQGLGGFFLPRASLQVLFYASPGVYQERYDMTIADG